MALLQRLRSVSSRSWPLYASLSRAASTSTSQLYTPAYEAVLIDAAGTLLSPSEPVAEVYLNYANKYGCKLTEDDILKGFRRAYNMPWTQSQLRYVGDARPFWRHIVTHATGCTSNDMFEEIYLHYARGAAWKLADGVKPALEKLKDAGLKLAVVSNFDTRLRPLLAELGVSHLFDHITISAEVGVEKPNPMIFELTLEKLRVHADNAVHVGDDRRNDVWGARDARVEAWLWGVDVDSFDAVVDRVLYGKHLEAEEAVA